MTWAGIHNTESLLVVALDSNLFRLGVLSGLSGLFAISTNLFLKFAFS